MKSILILSISIILISSLYAVEEKNDSPQLFPVEIRPANTVGGYNARLDSINLSGKEMRRRVEEREKEETLRNNLIRDFNPMSLEQWIDFVKDKDFTAIDTGNILRDISIIQSVSQKLEDYVSNKKKICRRQGCFT